jgi:salicylate hydroxylase
MAKPGYKLKVIINGGGLGGLGAAIALKKKGYDVTVLEGAPSLSEVRISSSP